MIKFQQFHENLITIISLNMNIKIKDSNKFAKFVMLIFNITSFITDYLYFLHRRLTQKIRT